MRRTHLVIGAIAAGVLALGGGAYAVADPSPSGSTVPQPNAAARSLSVDAGQVLSTTKRGTCVKNGTGEYRDLWLIEQTGKCPSGFWGPKVFGGAPGPQGPKGDPGDSRIAFASGSVKVTANGDTSVTVAGLPKFSTTQARRSLADVNGEALPNGVTVGVGEPQAAPGATSWTYPVKVSGLAPVAVATVQIDVIAAPVS